jgi:hypothetical protein
LGVWMALGLGEPGVLGSPSEDLPAYFWAMRAHLGNSLASGVLPWWVSQIYGGMPFLANPQVAGFYPPNWLYAVLPLNWAFNALTLGHLWWSGFGAGVLARWVGLRLPGAVLAGLVLVLSGPTLGRVYAGHVTMVAAAAWLPWALWLTGRVVTSRSVLMGSVVGLAVVIAAAFLAGLPQVFVYGAALTLLWVALLVALGGPGQRLHPAQLAIRLALVALAAWLGVMLAAVQWLPTLLYLGDASRQTITAEYRATYSLPLAHLAELVYGGWFGTTRETWWGAWLPWEMALFCGLPALMLAVAAPVLAMGGWLPRRGWAVIACGSLALFCLLFALGPATPLFSLLSSLPGFNQFRAPVRMLAWLPLFMGLLAGLGLDGLLRLAARTTEHSQLRTGMIVTPQNGPPITDDDGTQPTAYRNDGRIGRAGLCGDGRHCVFCRTPPRRPRCPPGAIPPPVV